jgi:cytochrome oxidase assembly protein ShyY1
VTFTIVIAVAVAAMFVAFAGLGRWVLRRIDDYPATIFGPLRDRRRQSS